MANLITISDERVPILAAIATKKRLVEIAKRLGLKELQRKSSDEIIFLIGSSTDFATEDLVEKLSRNEIKEAIVQSGRKVKSRSLGDLRSELFEAIARHAEGVLGALDAEPTKRQSDPNPNIGEKNRQILSSKIDLWGPYEECPVCGSWKSVLNVCLECRYRRAPSKTLSRLRKLWRRKLIDLEDLRNPAWWLRQVEIDEKNRSRAVNSARSGGKNHKFSQKTRENNVAEARAYAKKIKNKEKNRKKRKQSKRKNNCSDWLFGGRPAPKQRARFVSGGLPTLGKRR